ncbi:hypothetical protein A2801_03870 [Candidatus Woesebacteria bacterium RIFCSPHIGHO2_01_FULL_41_10]|uniref:Uncharacterized protein n=1 Tax=Candidatus Woesebacteria bacterium RIFCSPHIGHO2_01_FULL_41_10 TaxID=1802500 RepID=A0A1F7YS16_9BACT|nr:MAG: hypothetical protein A2801_03870 [Candidatus Woesebacteria bacterium RIFCSPHIGHO2_01_FULL_41_10]
MPQSARDKLKLKHLDEINQFNQNFASAKKSLDQKGISLSKLREHSNKIIAAGALASALALAPPQGDHLLPPPKEIIEKVTRSSSSLPVETNAVVLRKVLSQVLPEEPRALTEHEEKTLEQVILETTGVKAKANLEGEHLNTTYGLIGAEQHLRRYPGDTLAQHKPDADEYGGERVDEIIEEGITPGLGAWGYFAPSKEAFTPDLEETERWYAVVQTLYLPDWEKRQPYLKDWYKYRKVLIVNTENGKAVIASVADSGPAAFTGKQFGGSPEVMDYLGGQSYKKGAVLVFFVDDPNNEVSLGPVDYNKI